MKQIIDAIQDLKEKYLNINKSCEKSEIDRKEFTLLLSGISSLRKVPGIEEYMGFEELYHCGSAADENKVKEYLDRLFGVTDKDTLINACYEIFHSSNEYEQFMTFWKNAPAFDVNDLNEQGKESFTFCRQLASQFYKFVGEKGFYAWDINERIGLCRSAAACGIISEEQFFEITDDWVRLALVFYNSFGEYALSCLCGAVYDMGKHNPDVSVFFDINCRVIDVLLSDDGPWGQNKWYVPKEREWSSLIGSPLGCIISKEAFNTESVGYMYREEPQEGMPDSGWRFFKGDETEEYISNPNNSTVCALNTVCNICPDVMAYIHASIGRTFVKQDIGWVEQFEN